MSAARAKGSKSAERQQSGTIRHAAKQNGGLSRKQIAKAKPKENPKPATDILTLLQAAAGSQSSVTPQKRCANSETEREGITPEALKAPKRRMRWKQCASSTMPGQGSA